MAGGGPLRPFEFRASRQTRTITAAGEVAAAARLLAPPHFSPAFPAMDSLPGEDPTLPLEFSGSVNMAKLLDVSGDEVQIRLGGDGALPDVAEDTVSPTRARTMKDFENQIIELRKENFNLKLRIYYLEERMQQKFDGPNEDIYRISPH